MLDARGCDDLIDAVVTVSRAEIMPRFRRLAPGDIATKANPFDLVTEADLRAEEALGRAVAQILPGAEIVGEEAVSRDAARLDAIGTAEHCVIIDPIDGTANFAAGLAVFGVILAVVARGETIFGLLFDPVMEDWVVARRGDGAWLADTSGNASRLRASAREEMPGSRGLLPLNAHDGPQRGPFLSQFSDVGQVQDLRCSCHDYRLLASGEADFLVSVALNPWDHAAGQLAIAEAGAWSQVDGEARYSPRLRQGRMVAAGTEALAADVTRCLPARA
ncbi:inositol monophosphatase family protein [Roseivivax sp.]